MGCADLNQQLPKFVDYYYLTAFFLSNFFLPHYSFDYENIKKSPSIGGVYGKPLVDQPFIGCSKC